VVNFELPHVAEDYIHRIGRTGRAGRTGEALSLVCGLSALSRVLKMTGRRSPSSNAAGPSIRGVIQTRRASRKVAIVVGVPADENGRHPARRDKLYLSTGSAASAAQEWRNVRAAEAAPPRLFLHMLSSWF